MKTSKTLPHWLLTAVLALAAVRACRLMSCFQMRMVRWGLGQRAFDYKPDEPALRPDRLDLRSAVPGAAMPATPAADVIGGSIGWI